MPTQTQTQTNETNETNENRKPILTILKLSKIYVEYKGKNFKLKNVEWTEIEDVLDDIIKRYDEGYAYVPTLKHRLIESGKLIIEDGRIEIYGGTYSDIVAMDMVLYLVGRFKVDDETAYEVMRRLKSDDKLFIEYLIMSKTYEIEEDELKQLYKIMEGIVKYHYPGLILRSRTRKTEEY